MKKRTEEEWRRLHERAIFAILAGRTANYVQSSYTQSVDEAICGADYLVEELQKIEEMETKRTSLEQ